MCNDCNCKCLDEGKHKPVPHKHAEVIKAWADGATIQINMGTKANPKWQDISIKNPCWDSDGYRVKPEPKPDVVSYLCLGFLNTGSQSFDRCALGHDHTDILRLCWDGETNKLKSVEIIK